MPAKVSSCKTLKLVALWFEIHVTMTHPSSISNDEGSALNTHQGASNTLGALINLSCQHGLTRLEAQCLMLKAMGRAQSEKVWLYTHDQTELTPTEESLFWADVRRRLAHVPLAYITQESCFYGLPLKVDERALDPRSDTEVLVDWALEILNSKKKVSTNSPIRPLNSLNLNEKMLKVVDLGCGSGAIALALKKNAPECEVWAIDQSLNALDLTQHNAQALSLQLMVRQGSWLEGIESHLFDLIVSNPPYIAPGDPHLENLLHEPLSALVSPEEGMADIRAIAKQAISHLKAGAWLLFEHGHDQSARVRETLEDLGYINIKTRPDLAGIPRCTGGQSPNME